MLLGLECPSGRLWSEQEASLGLMTGVPWPTVRTRECGVVAERRLIGRTIWWHVVELRWITKMMNKHSRTVQITLDECTKFKKVVVKTAVFNASSGGFSTFSRQDG